MAEFDDDQFTFYSMVTDSTYSERIDGLWFSSGDTLTLYSQDKGTKNFILKHLSMNTMAIEDGKDRLVMSRIYHDENRKFAEVLELKGGFWWCVFYVFRGIGIAFFFYGILYAGYQIIKELVDKINSNKST